MRRLGRRSILGAPALAWAILVMACFGLLLCNTDRYAWSNVSAVAGKDFSLSPVFAISVFATAAQLGFLISVVIGGLVTDWAGAWRVLGIAVTLLGLATLGFGRSISIGMSVTMQLAMGLSAGPIYSAGVKAVSTWFAQIGRATAIGLFMTATSLAVVAANSVIPRWLERDGWRYAFHYLGVITVLGGMLSSLL